MYLCKTLTHIKVKWNLNKEPGYPHAGKLSQTLVSGWECSSMVEHLPVHEDCFHTQHCRNTVKRPGDESLYHIWEDDNRALGKDWCVRQLESGTGPLVVISMLSEAMGRCATRMVKIRVTFGKTPGFQRRGHCNWDQECTLEARHKSIKPLNLGYRQGRWCSGHWWNRAFEYKWGNKKYQG